MSQERRQSRITRLITDFGLTKENAIEIVEYQEEQERVFSNKCEEFSRKLKEEIMAQNRAKLAEVIGRPQEKP